jgi:hypothetical protein
LKDSGSQLYLYYMDIAEIRQTRYFLSLDALLSEIPIPLDDKWHVVLYKGNICKTRFNKLKKKQIYKEIDFSLKDFLTTCELYSDHNLKYIFSSLKLLNLQNNLLGNNKNPIE